MSRWDPCTPQFLVSTMRAMAGILVVACLAAACWFRPAFWGVLTGGLVALAAFLIALSTARTVSPEAGYSKIMTLLQLKQWLLWIGIAVLIMVVKVEPAGFAFGVSVLPVGILLTLGWYLLPRGNTQS